LHSRRVSWLKPSGKVIG